MNLCVNSILIIYLLRRLGTPKPFISLKLLSLCTEYVSKSDRFKTDSQEKNFFFNNYQFY